MIRKLSPLLALVKEGGNLLQLSTGDKATAWMAESQSGRVVSQKLEPLKLDSKALW